MRRQPFGAGDLGGDGAEAGRSGVVELDDAGDFDKVGYVQRRGEAGGAAGGHDVAGTGYIIAQHLEAAFADEQAASVGDFIGISGRVGHGQAGVFGGELAGELARFVHIGGQDNAALAVEGGGNGFGAAQRFHLLADFYLHGRCQFP